MGPRDGIQSEKAEIATEDKVRLIEALAGAGLRFIEAVSFVSPKAVPQMADAAEVWAAVKANRAEGVFYSALVPNAKGASLAAEAGVDGLQVFLAASDGYNLKNVGKTVDESFADVEAVVKVAEEASLPVEGTISSSFGDAYEGDVPPERVVEVSKRMTALGITGISYGDTTGMATPRGVREVVEAVGTSLPEVDINLHLHDTRGTGLANVLMGLSLGVDYYDSSIGGMGGSPFASGATGNVATEDLVHMLTDMGIETGVDFDELIVASGLARGLVQGDLPAKVSKAGPRWAVGD